MRTTIAVASVPPHNDEPCPPELRMARGYLRYYQRGSVIFVAAFALTMAAEFFVPAGIIPDKTLPWSRAALAVAAVLFVVGPYGRKVAALFRVCREPIRRFLNLLSESKRS